MGEVKPVTDGKLAVLRSDPTYPAGLHWQDVASLDSRIDSDREKIASLRAVNKELLETQAILVAALVEFREASASWDDESPRLLAALYQVEAALARAAEEEAKQEETR